MTRRPKTPKIKTSNDAVIHVRLPSEQKASFIQSAARAGMGLSIWIRFAGAEKAARENKP